MISYFLLFFITGCCIITYDIAKHTKYKSLASFCILTITIFIVGFRYKVGVDTYNYMYHYADVPLINNIEWNDLFAYNYQPLFLLLSSACKSINSDFYLFQLIHATIVNTIIFSFIRKNTSYTFTGYFIYLTTYFMYFNFEILKESLAVVVFLIGYQQLEKGKLFKFYLYVIIAFLFHISAIITIFFPLIKHLKLNKRFYFTAIGFTIFLAFSYSFLGLFSFWGKLAQKAITYATVAEQSVLNFNWLITQMLIYVIFPFILLITFKKKISSYSCEHIFCFTILLGLGIIEYQIVFSRFINYCIPFIFLCCTNIIGESYRQKTGIKICKIGLISLFLFIFNYNFLSHNGYSRWYPYYSILNEQINKDREKLWGGFNL